MSISLDQSPRVLPWRRSSAYSQGHGTPRFESLEDRRLLAVVPEGFTETQVAAKLSSPTALDVAPDGRVFVAQQNGVIRIIENDVLLPTPFASLAADGSGERGLEGITLDPNFATNHYVYVYYTATSPQSHNRVSRLTAMGNEALPGSETVLFELPNLSTVGDPIWHMGGSIQFGPDGKLYVAVGEHQQPSLSQSLSSPFGKILRINVDGAIPTDNPFYNTATGNNRAIWALGLRNPYTTAFQPGTGRFFINDVGGGSWEEINLGVAGANYGWPTTEGYFNQAQYPQFTEPQHAYSHSEDCAITGGAFYDPAVQQFPASYEGKYFFAEFCSGEIRLLDPANPAESQPFLTEGDYPIGIEVGPDGTLWYLSRGIGAGGADGTNLGGVHKVEYVANVPPGVVLAPQDLLVSVGQAAAFSVSASGTQPLEYQWQRQDPGALQFTNIPDAKSSEYVLPAAAVADHGAKFRVVVSNAFGSIESAAATLSVTTTHPPVATILLPADGAHYNAGDTIQFSGQGHDDEDGALGADKLTWWVEFHHDTHSHPFYPPTSGIASGSFVIPTTGETDPDVYYRIYLQVQDSLGLKHETYRDVVPNLAQLRLTSNVPGAEIELDGQPKATPFETAGVVNLQRTVSAARFARVGGQDYQFVRWESGQTERTQAFSLAAGETEWRAVYEPVTVTYVSDLPYVGTPTNGWGPPERDRSNGETGAADGHPLTVDGVVYAKGLGVHADSRVEFDLNGQYERFAAVLGLDDETGPNGSVVFRVLLDGQVAYTSPTLTGSSAALPIDLPVSGKDRLVLQVLQTADGNGYDHADWADARLIQPSAITTPAAPQNLAAAAVTSSAIRLTWQDAATTETGFRVERRLAEGDFSQVAELPANTTEWLDDGLAVSTAYEYRVRAFNVAGPSDYSPVAAATTEPADLIKVNFQPAGSATYFNYRADTGLVYGNRGSGLSFGWNADNSAQTRDRDSAAAPDQRYDTLIHLQKPENPNAKWEIAVPVGWYRVHVVAGDPDFVDGRMNTLVEGVAAFDAVPSAANHWIEGTVVVQVTDGRLTLGSGPQATNNKLSFVEINPLPTVNVELLAGAAGGSTVAQIALEFSEPVFGLELADLALRRGGGDNLLPASATLTSADHKRWLLGNLGELTAAAGDYLFTLLGQTSGVADAAGAGLAADLQVNFGVASFALPGDANHDGRVDLSDFGLLKELFGRQGPGSAADFDHNGVVDLSDFGVLKDNFGKQ